ncbi:MAG: hypothetical protein HY331_05395 [Chloroflexi bacterium]|nr:hypothetical protein [Chloroflexota bacterium]
MSARLAELAPRMTVGLLDLARRIAERAAFLLLGLSAAGFAVHAVLSILYPYPLDYGEGAVLTAAAELARGQPLYRLSDISPALSANYPPIYYLLNAAAVAAFGPVLWPGRLLSLVGVALAAAALAAEVRRLTGHRQAALLAAAFLLALGPIYHWGAVAKADALALGLAAAGLALLGHGRRWAGPLLLLLAVLTKQSYLTAWLAGLVWLAWQHRGPLHRIPHGADAFSPSSAVAMIGGLLGSVGLIEAASGGHFLSRAVADNVQPLVSGQSPVALLLHFQQRPVLLLMGLVGFSALLRQPDSRRTPWLPAYAIAWPALAITAGKVGAYTNYYLETLAVSCLFAGIAWSRSHDLGKVARLAIAVLLLLQAVMLVRVPFLYEEVPTPGPRAFAAGGQVVGVLRSAPGPAFAENAAWLVLAGRQPALDDPFFFAQLARLGRWDDGPIVDRLSRGAYERLALDFDPADRTAPPYHRDRFTPAMLDAVERRYRLLERYGDVYLLVPR